MKNHKKSQDNQGIMAQTTNVLNSLLIFYLKPCGLNLELFRVWKDIQSSLFFKQDLEVCEKMSVDSKKYVNSMIKCSVITWL